MAHDVHSDGRMETRTSYLGFSLPHPFIAGASPFGHSLDTVKKLEDAGCAAIVLHSLFEEQITAAAAGHIHHMNILEAESAEVVAQFPDSTEYPMKPDEYVEHVYRVKRAVSIPVVGSLNGTSAEAWLKFARVIEEAGADALELNLYGLVTSFSASSAAVEGQIATLVHDLKQLLRIPVAVKLSPYFTAFASLARQLDAAGADGLVLFNRFYQPDIDIKTMELSPLVDLATSAELRLRLRWLAVLYGRVRPSLVVTGGVVTPDDGIKAILAGADAVQLVSGLLRHGPAHVQKMLAGLERWMAWHKFETLDEVRGRVSHAHHSDAEIAERAGYIRTLQSWGR
jgi:dihydroorotate dehydrogenase (fumarate)